MCFSYKYITKYASTLVKFASCILFQNVVNLHSYHQHGRMEEPLLSKGLPSLRKSASGFYSSGGGGGMRLCFPLMDHPPPPPPMNRNHLRISARGAYTLYINKAETNNQTNKLYKKKKMYSLSRHPPPPNLSAPLSKIVMPSALKNSKVARLNFIDRGGGGGTHISFNMCLFWCAGLFVSLFSPL